MSARNPIVFCVLLGVFVVHFTAAAQEPTVARRTDDSVRSPSQSPDHGVNLERFARAIIRDRTNLTIMGDSIHHPGQPTTMFVGHLLEWRPVRWRQFRPPVNANSSINGVWLETSSTAFYRYLRPGQDSSFSAEVSGTAPFSIKLMSGAAWHGRALSSGINKNAFGDDWGLFRNANSEQTFGRTAGVYRHRVLAVTSAQPDQRSTWSVASRNSSSGNQWTIVEENRSFPVTAIPALTWLDQEITGDPSGAGHQGSSLLLAASAALVPGEHVGLGGTIITSLEDEVGLGIDFVGEGGWRVENHLFETGDPRLPEISSSDGPYVGGYATDALARHFAAHETTHVMLYIGVNNGGVNANQPELVAERIDAVIARCRDAQELRATMYDGAEPLEFLVVAPYPTNTHAYYPEFASVLRTLAGEDVAFLDLHGLVLDRFGSYESWESSLLRDGVHPSLEGARQFSSLMWRELVAAAGPTADLNRNGQVDGGDFGLLLLDWGRSKHPGPADLDGDGLVDGADLGIMLQQWSDTAP